jgi:hypothetical protein
LTALFGADARISARRIDKSKDRQLEFFSELHQAQCLAVAFRPGHSEVAVDFVFGIAALLMADHHHWLILKAGKPRHDRRIVGVGAVAV